MLWRHVAAWLVMAAGIMLLGWLLSNITTGACEGCDEPGYSTLLPGKY